MGQWQENAVAYIYTKRRDVGTYECFVGSLNGQEIFIKEAGEHCQRDIDPNRYGMQLKQIKYCNSNHHKVTKHPVIGHMNAVIISRNIQNVTNSIDSVPVFVPMPPDDKTRTSPIAKNHGIIPTVIESATYGNQEQTTYLRGSTGHDDIHQDDNSDKSTASVSGDSIQFIVNNDTSHSKVDQQYVISTVVTSPGNVDDTQKKSSTTISESSFNHAKSCFEFKIDYVILITGVIANCRLLFGILQ